MTVVKPNCTVTITAANGIAIATGVIANMQQDGSGDAQIPRLLTGAGGSDGDFRYAYRVRTDIPATLPGMGDMVTVVTHPQTPVLVGSQWTIWREPELTMGNFPSVVMRVVRKIS